ncbi:MAG: DUF6712 family protein [Bacteroidales bacterium]
MLFNRDNKGKEEMKAILGFIFATHSFDNLRTDIILAEDDFRFLLGSDLFSAIDEFYHSAEYNLPDEQDTSRLTWNELVRRTQQALAFYAYRSYASHADLTHSDKGRQIHVSENEKPAFEWMIERDDQSMLSKAHKLTDRLLAFLEEHKEDEKINLLYATKPVYAATRELFINTAAEFDRVFPIEGSRRFYLKVVPFIREVENTRILSVLGQEQFDQMKVGILDGTLTEASTQLLEKVRVPLALYTMVTAIRRLSVEVLPEGVFQQYIPGIQSVKARNPSPMEFMNEVARNLEQEANASLLVLQQHLAKSKAVSEGSTFSSQNLFSRNDSQNKHFRA